MMKATCILFCKKGDFQWSRRSCHKYCSGNTRPLVPFQCSPHPPTISKFASPKKLCTTLQILDGYEIAFHHAKMALSSTCWQHSQYPIDLYFAWAILLHELYIAPPPNYSLSLYTKVLYTVPSACFSTDFYLI